MSVLMGLWVVALTGAADGAAVNVRVTLTPPEIPFHKQALFAIEADAPAGVDVVLPDMTGKFGGADIGRPAEKKDQPLDNGRHRVSVVYRLEAVKPGDYVIAPVEVTWAPNGRTVVPSPALRVRDLTPVEEAAVQQFQPIVEPRAPGPPFWRRWPFWAVVGAIALSVVGWILWRRMGGAPSVTPQRVLLPWERALARLSSLRERHLDSNGYYVELSAILREYIEERFHIHAPEQTTPEFLAEAVQGGQFSGEQQKMLAGVLRHSDRVKFARYEPTEEEMVQAYEDVRRFIEETIPRAPTEAPEAAP